MTRRIARPRATLRKGRTDWYRIENKGSGTVNVYLYDEIGYWGVTAKDFVDELREVKASQIELHVNSPGGDVFDGVAIYNALKQHKANVKVVVDSLAASAASFIAMAGDEIVMARNAEMMIHDAMGLCVGNAADMRDMVDRLDKVSDNIADIYAQRTGSTVEQWRERMTAETWYSAHEAVEAGLADSVLGEDSETENSWDLSIFNFSSRAEAPEPVIEPARPQAVQQEPSPNFEWDPELFRRAFKEASNA